MAWIKSTRWQSAWWCMQSTPCTIAYATTHTISRCAKPLRASQMKFSLVGPSEMHGLTSSVGSCARQAGHRVKTSSQYMCIFFVYTYLYISVRKYIHIHNDLAFLSERRYSQFDGYVRLFPVLASKLQLHPRAKCNLWVRKPVGNLLIFLPCLNTHTFRLPVPWEGMGPQWGVTWATPL